MTLMLAACATTPPLPHRAADAALLAAQARREQALVGVHRWTLVGKLGISDGHHGGSGEFTWTQDGGRYVFELRAPLGVQSFRLSGGPDGAMLEGVDGGPLRGADAEALMRRVFGWEVPMDELRAWVLGIRAPGAAVDGLYFDAQGLPAELRQSGWTVDYPSWDDQRQPPLPRQVFAARPPYTVRLAIQSWTLP